MPPRRPRNFYLIWMLGTLYTLTPMSIDLYLPAFAQIAEDFATTTSRVSLSLSSYFLGVALGQLFYGPLLDRFGRKRPLYAGLTLFMFAALGCLSSKSVEALIFFRFLQALGGCVASVSGMAMVRDFFPPREGARVFSMLMLVLSVSPLLAPTFGGLIVTYLHWPWVFAILAMFALALIFMIRFFMPEGHTPDKTINLRPYPILKTYLEILKTPQFNTYAIAGALGFSGLFAYIAGSTVIFLEIFKVTPNIYSWIFAFIAMGLIGAGQINNLLMKKFKSEQIFRGAIAAQFLTGIVFFTVNLFGGIGLYGTIAMLFLFMSFGGLTNPNASALALAPFSRNAGSASAVLGSLQIGIGSLASACVGLLPPGILPVASILMGASGTGLLFLHFAKKRIVQEVEVTEVQSMSH